MDLLLNREQRLGMMEEGLRRRKKGSLTPLTLDERECFKKVDESSKFKELPYRKLVRVSNQIFKLCNWKTQIHSQSLEYNLQKLTQIHSHSLEYNLQRLFPL